MNPLTLAIIDYSFTIFHLAIIGFNLLGWASQKTKQLHRWCVSITASCWLIIGMAVGTIGYCPLTDWHWKIKYMRGAQDLPSSFVTWLFHQIEFYPPPNIVDIGVGTSFSLIVIITISLFIQERFKTKTSSKYR